MFVCLFACLFVCFCNVHIKLISLLFQSQRKALINRFQHCSIYLFGFFETRPDWVTFIPSGATGFDGLIVADEVTGFGKLAVCGGTTLSSWYDIVVTKFIGKFLVGRYKMPAISYHGISVLIFFFFFFFFSVLANLHTTTYKK